MFEAELAQQVADVDLARASLYIAMHRTPELDVEAYVARLDELAAELQPYLPPEDERYTRRMLLAINKWWEAAGFRAAGKGEFGTAASNCLDVCLDQRMGIPLTLSLIYMEVARRAGLSMVGVNLPAHYMVRPAIEDCEVLVDPFNGGALISVEDAEELLSPLYGNGARAEIDRSFFSDNSPKPRAFLTRMCTNMKQYYFNSRQFDSALLIIDYQALCAPDGVCPLARIACANSTDMRMRAQPLWPR